MRQSCRLFLFFAAVALTATAAGADGYPWTPSASRASGPLPWTGPYLGLNLGYGWHDVSGLYDGLGSPTDLSGTEPNGAVVGGQIGYNQRMNWFLMGIELDADTSIESSSVIDQATNANIKGDLGYLASARGRIGVLFNDVLLYGTFGVAAARYTFTEVNGPFIGQIQLKDTGAVYGGGLEWMVAYGVSLRTEYLRYDMGDGTFLPTSFPDIDPGDFVKFRDINVARAGVNIRLAP